MVEIITNTSGGGGGYSYVNVDSNTMSGDGQLATPLKSDFSQAVYTNSDAAFQINKQGNYINTAQNASVLFRIPQIYNGTTFFPAVNGIRVLVYTKYKLDISLVGEGVIPVFFQGAFGQQTVVANPAIIKKMTQINEKKIYEFIFLKGTDSPLGIDSWLCTNTLAVPVNSFSYTLGETPANTSYSIIYYGVHFLDWTSEGEPPANMKIILPNPSLFDGMVITIINYVGIALDFDTNLPVNISGLSPVTTCQSGTVVEMVSTNGYWVINYNGLW